MPANYSYKCTKRICKFVYLYKLRIFLKNLLTNTQSAYIIKTYTERVYRKGGGTMNAYMYPNIEAERVRIGFTQDELVKALGYKERKTYYNWLSSGNIPQKVLVKMAEIFGCTIDYLLGCEQNKPSA